MKRLILFLLFICSVAVATVPEKIRNDVLQIGIDGSTTTKVLSFDVGDGASNPSLSVDTTSKEFTTNKSINVAGEIKATGNDSTFGDGTTANKKTIYDIGSGSANPYLGYDSTSNALVFSNDGVIKKKIGAGEGGAGGLMSLDNSGFEDGITSDWTCTSGKCSEVTLEPLWGLKSLKFDPTVQNDSFQSDLKTIAQGLKGVACEARAYYIGGDENLTAQVLDENGLVIGSTVLQAHPNFGYESVFFLCPSVAAIAGDALKGNLQLQVINATATPAATSTFDEMYNGSLLGLVEMATPDLFSATVNPDGDTIISDNVQNWLSCTDGGVGISSCTYNGLDLTVAMSCVVSINEDIQEAGLSIMLIGNSLTGFTIRTFNSADNAASRSWSVECQKQYPDAKQSVQVYKSIPKIAQNVNNFSAEIDSGGTASGENVPFILNVTKGGTGIYNISYIANTFSVAPNPTAIVNSTGTWGASVSNITSTGCSVRLWSDGGTLLDAAFVLKLQKSTDDYKMPTVQPVLVNQVENSLASGIRVESCKIVNSGAASISDISGLCGNWIDSVTWSSTGATIVTMTSGIFSVRPSCVCSIPSDNYAVCGMEASSTTTINVGTKDFAGTRQDRDYIFTCTGVR